MYPYQRRILPALAAAALLATACGGAAAPTATPRPAATTPPAAATATPTRAPTPTAAGPTAGGVLKTTMQGNFSGLEPVQGTGGADHPFLWSMYDPLVGYDKDMVSRPERSLAEKWDFPDPTTIRFTLRKGVKFHDGTPLNAEAVRVNWQYHVKKLWPDVPSTTAGDLATITDVAVLDEYTAEFKLKEPHAPLITLMGDRPGMLNSPAALKNPPGGDPKRLVRVAVGAGAFKFKEEVLDDHITLVKNTNYWQPGRPYLDEITWRIVPDTQVALTALKTGEVNFLWSPPAKDIKALKADSKMKVLQREGVWVDMIYLNSVKTKAEGNAFADVHNRRAIAYAMDRKELLDVIGDGQGAVARGLVGPGNYSFDPKFEGIQYNPVKAKEELALAGNPNGYKFELRISNTPVGIQQGELLKSQAAKVGIQIDLRPLPSPDVYLNFFRNKEGVSFWAAFSGRADPWQTLVFLYHPGGLYGSSGTQLDDKELTPLIDQARKTYDLNERIRLYREADRIGIERSYGLYTYYPFVTYAMDPKVQIEQFGDGKPHFGQGDVWIKR